VMKPCKSRVLTLDTRLSRPSPVILLTKKFGAKCISAVALGGLGRKVSGGKTNLYTCRPALKNHPVVPASFPSA
jgi:hypothetical protein